MAQQNSDSFHPQRSDSSSPDETGETRSTSVPGWQTVEFPSAVSADASERQSRYAQFMTRKPGKVSSGASRQSPQSAPQSAAQSAEGLIALIQDTNQRNHELMDRVAQLEEALEQSRQALQQELDRVDAVDDGEQASEADADAAQQVSYLLTQLEFAQQANQRQEILVETLTRQLEASQTRVNQLEKECDEFHQTLAQQSTKIRESDRLCRDLQARLQRQQQYTLQFKVALDKCLEVPPPSYETGAPPSGEAARVEYPTISSTVAIPQIPLAEGAIPPVNLSAPDSALADEDAESISTPSGDVSVERLPENTVLTDSLIPKINHIRPWSVDDRGAKVSSESSPLQLSSQEEPARESQMASTPPDLFAARFQDTLRDLVRTEPYQPSELPMESQGTEDGPPLEPQSAETLSSSKLDVPSTELQAGAQIGEQANEQTIEQQRSPTPTPDPQRMEMPEIDQQNAPISLTEKLSDLLGSERYNQPESSEANARSESHETDLPAIDPPQPESPRKESEPSWVKWRSFLPPDLRQSGDRPSRVETTTNAEVNAGDSSAARDIQLPGEPRSTHSDALGASVDQALSKAEPNPADTESQLPMDDEPDIEEKQYGTDDIAKLVNATADEILRIQQATEKNEFSTESPRPESLSEIFSEPVESESQDDGPSSFDFPTYRQDSIQSTEPAPDPWTTTPGSYLNPSSGSEKVTSIPPFSVARSSDDDTPLWAIARPSQTSSTDGLTSELDTPDPTHENQSPPGESEVSPVEDVVSIDVGDAPEGGMAQKNKTLDDSGAATSPDASSTAASSERLDKRETDSTNSAASAVPDGADTSGTADAAEVSAPTGTEKSLRDVSLYTPSSDDRASHKRTSFNSLVFSVSSSPTRSKPQGAKQSDPTLPSDESEKEWQQQSVAIPQRPTDADKKNPNWPAPMVSPPKTQKQEKGDDDNDTTGTPIDLPAFLR